MDMLPNAFQYHLRFILQEHVVIAPEFFFNKELVLKTIRYSSVKHNQVSFKYDHIFDFKKTVISPV